MGFEDERHQVVSLAGDVVGLRAEESGARQSVLLALLLADETFQAGAESPEDDDGPVHDADAGKVDPGGVLASLPAAVRAAALEVEAHIRELETGFRSGDPLRPSAGEPRAQYAPGVAMRERGAAKAAELGLTARQVWNLRTQYRDQGLWGVVDKRRAKVSNPVGNVDPRVVQAIRDQAQAERNDSSATVGGRFYRRVQNRLTADHGPGVVPVPSANVFRRAVTALLTDSPAGPAYRRQTAGNQPDRSFGNVIATRPGEVVMMDTTPLDVLAYDPVTDSTMRIELTCALDVATRSLLAWRITPEGTKGIDIGLLLADVMTPEPMRPDWADALRYRMLQVPYERLLSVDERLAEAAARPVVYPETIVFDHGKPYTSDVVRDACLRWRISLQDARKLKPTDKPQVERLFRTIREQFAEHVAGYKGFNVAHRGRTVEAQARWTVDDITEFFAEYVVAVYQRRHHRGLTLHGFPDLRVSPNEAYRMALGAAGFVDCPRDANLYYELLPIERRTIQPAGVQLGYLTYNADILYRYRRAQSPYPGGLWPIRYDPRNLLHAYFVDPADGRWHVLRWTHALSDHQPFTDITIREAKRLVEARGAAPDDQEAVAAALRDLQNRTDAPETWQRDRRRSFRDRERAASQARDVRRSTPAVDDRPPLALLPELPDGDDGHDDGGWGGVDLSTIEPAELWTPSTGEDSSR
ncbi:Mu transposase C-terminal domain-containing protein [Kitasatospora kazusensis]|uniref:Mu transposase C-terminal domain-containing protein n=1 Tax=Kitasatospora kazusensis TaxID=407974 RepID=UPI0031D5D728